MREKLIKCLAVAAAIASIGALYGCGGGSTTAAQGTTSGSEADGSKPPWDRPRASKSSPRYKDFIEKADVICNRGKQQGFQAMTAYLERHKNSDEPEARRLLEAIQAAYLPAVERQIEEIKALDPPEGEGWQVRAFLGALGEGIHSERGTAIDPQFNQSFEHSAELARVLGVKACVYSHFG